MERKADNRYVPAVSREAFERLLERAAALGHNTQGYQNTHESVDRLTERIRQAEERGRLPRPDEQS